MTMHTPLYGDLTHAERAALHRATAAEFRRHKRVDHSAIDPATLAEAEDHAAKVEEAFAAEEAFALTAGKAR